MTTARKVFCTTQYCRPITPVEIIASQNGKSTVRTTKYGSYGLNHALTSVFNDSF